MKKLLFISLFLSVPAWGIETVTETDTETIRDTVTELYYQTSDKKLGQYNDLATCAANLRKLIKKGKKLGIEVDYCEKKLKELYDIEEKSVQAVLEAVKYAEVLKEKYSPDNNRPKYRIFPKALLPFWKKEKELHNDRLEWDKFALRGSDSKKIPFDTRIIKRLLECFPGTVKGSTKEELFKM